MTISTVDFNATETIVIMKDVDTKENKMANFIKNKPVKLLTVGINLAFENYGPLNSAETLKGFLGLGPPTASFHKGKMARGAFIKTLLFCLLFAGFTTNLGFGQEVTTNEFFEEMNN